MQVASMLRKVNDLAIDLTSKTAMLDFHCVI
jgi:hypothetical protein